jgi:hypothetical protein
MEGRAEGLSWSDGRLFYSAGWFSRSPGVNGTVGYFQLDPERLAVKALPGYQLRSEDLFSVVTKVRPRPGDGWVLVGRHIIAGPGWLYAPDGKGYHYDPTNGAHPLGQSPRLAERDRKIIGRVGRGFVIVQYRNPPLPPYGSAEAPFLWYVEPREVKGNPGGTKP